MVQVQAQIFDSVRTGAQVCFLLKRELQSKRFAVVLKLETGWFCKFDKFRDSFILSVATEDINFNDLQAQSSFVGYGMPDSASEIDVYEISQEARDRIPPNETSPSWKFLIERMPNERFTIPE